MIRKQFLSFPRPSSRLVRRKIHRWRFGMFKSLTDATSFLARQAVELRKERVYSPKAQQQPCQQFGRAVSVIRQNLKTIKTFEEKSREIMVRKKIVK